MIVEQQREESGRERSLLREGEGESGRLHKILQLTMQIRVVWNNEGFHIFIASVRFYASEWIQTAFRWLCAGRQGMRNKKHSVTLLETHSTVEVPSCGLYEQRLSNCKNKNCK